MLDRWRYLLFVGGCILAVSVLAQPVSLPGWEQWRAQYVNVQGRVIDTGQDGISHSEGQGFGLLLAAAAGDRASFERIWEWTHLNLQIRGDALFAWRWNAHLNKVDDLNNASDGDMLIAWGLLRGAQAFNQPAWRDQARKILVDVRTKLLRPVKDGLVILPAEKGFESAAGTVLNLSYLIYPAFADFEKVDSPADWRRLRDTGLSYVDKTHLGRWGLPPDTLLDVSPPVTAPHAKPWFGYDAVRIPLYLKWAGLATAERMKPYQTYWHYFDGARFVPAWTNLNDNSIDSYNAMPGILAIRQWVLGQGVMNPLPARDESYYSATLRMLVWLAAH